MDTKRVVYFNVILILFNIHSSVAANELNRNDFYHYFARNIIPNTELAARFSATKLNPLDERLDNEVQQPSLKRSPEIGTSEANRPVDIDALENMMAQIKAGEKRLAHFLRISEPQNNRKRETGDVYKNMFLGVRG